MPMVGQYRYSFSAELQTLSFDNGEYGSTNSGVLQISIDNIRLFARTIKFTMNSNRDIKINRFSIK
jgi:hypothetical protein